MSADILRELAFVKATFQLRALEAILRGPAIAMARDSAETACPAPVPKDCQARAGTASPKGGQ